MIELFADTVIDKVLTVEDSIVDIIAFDIFKNGKFSSKNDSPPSKRRKRSSGYGGSYIEYREVKRNHKVYDQYWYHYEFWDKGDVVTKKSRYIPKRLIAKVERMNDDKVAVREDFRGVE